MDFGPLFPNPSTQNHQLGNSDAQENRSKEMVEEQKEMKTQVDSRVIQERQGQFGGPRENTNNGKSESSHTSEFKQKPEMGKRMEYRPLSTSAVKISGDSEQTKQQTIEQATGKDGARQMMRGKVELVETSKVTVMEETDLGKYVAHFYGSSSNGQGFFLHQGHSM